MQKRISRAPFTIYHLPSTNHGFTIVELLVVIVIIGILAAISIVTYGGVQNRAIATSLQSDLTNASDQLVIDQARSNTGVFPATLAAASGTIKWSANTTPSYTVNNTNTPKTFCLTATKSNQSYFITQEGLPMPGPCPVLYFDAGIQTSYPGAGTAWYDLSGKGNNGVAYNTTYSSSNGGSLVFNGSNSRIYIADPANGSLDFGTGSFTIEAWFKFGSYGGDYRTLVWKGAGGGLSGWRFGLSTAGVPHILIGDTVGYVDSDLGATPLSLNTWHYLAIVYNRTSNAVGYVDGVKGGSVSISARSGNISDPASGVNIGNSYTWFNGQIGIVNIRNAVLSDNDIVNTWKALKGRYGL